MDDTSPMAPTTKGETRILLRDFAHLPEEIQFFLQDGSFSEMFDALAERQGLSRKDALSVKMVTFSLLIGTLSPEKFIDSLAWVFAGDRNRASALAKEINADILSAVKDTLIEIHKHAKTSSRGPQFARGASIPQGSATEKERSSVIPSMVTGAPTPLSPSTLEQKLAGTFSVSSAIPPAPPAPAPSSQPQRSLSSPVSHPPNEPVLNEPPGQRVSDPYREAVN
jgi:hypothetical protein